ncbi:hypothetical protein HID58_087831 [Brassica napus]|uniref:Uncharacterized protein n=1 Tax=Brassica napus TaxID=3708 RepID=A0ABQ7XUF5_BRANA|nr:hypothetical protein HID58_087831 [Brassica napus]
MMNTTPTVDFRTPPRHASCLVLVSIVLYNSNHHPQLTPAHLLLNDVYHLSHFHQSRCVLHRSRRILHLSTRLKPSQVEALLFHD